MKHTENSKYGRRYDTEKLRRVRERIERWRAAGTLKTIAREEGVSLTIVHAMAGGRYKFVKLKPKFDVEEAIRELGSAANGD